MLLAELKFDIAPAFILFLHYLLELYFSRSLFGQYRSHWLSAVLSGDSYPDSAAVLEDSVITFIPKEDFLETIGRSDVLNRRLLKTLSHEFAVLANSLTLFAQKSVRERLALQLIVIREKYKVDFEPGMPVEINMGRDDLASLVGTARENVVRMLSEFREEGIVATKGRKIIVLDVKRLIKIANYR